jgi:hypothetical protein
VNLPVCQEKWQMKLTCLWNAPTHNPPAVIRDTMAASANVLGNDKISRSQDEDKQATQTG